MGAAVRSQDVSNPNLTQSLLGDASAQPGVSKVVALYQKTKAYFATTRTHYDGKFEWTLADREIAWTELARLKNDFVTTHWSPNFFTGSKRNVEKIKNSAINLVKDTATCPFKVLANLLFLVVAIGSWDKQACEEHLQALGLAIFNVFVGIGNTGLLVAKEAISIEVLNLVKGIAGFTISTLKLVLHLALTIGCFSKGIGLLMQQAIGFGKWNDTKDAFSESFSYFIDAIKDLVQAVTCVGHAIPSWLAPVIALCCPISTLPTIAILLIKQGTKYAGLSDLIGYGGTLMLLWLKTKTKTGSDDEAKATAKIAQTAFNTLKTELNPFESVEGAMLATFGLHVVVSFVETILDLIGVGPFVNELLKPILKYTLEKSADLVIPAVWAVGNLAYLGIHKLLSSGDEKENDSLVEPIGGLPFGEECFWIYDSNEGDPDRRNEHDEIFAAS